MAATEASGLLATQVGHLSSARMPSAVVQASDGHGFKSAERFSASPPSKHLEVLTPPDPARSSDSQDEARITAL